MSHPDRFEMRCENCRWFVAVSDELGECHGGPPPVAVELVGEDKNDLRVFRSTFPIVSVRDWCAVFVRKLPIVSPHVEQA